MSDDIEEKKPKSSTAESLQVVAQIYTARQVTKLGRTMERCSETLSSIEKTNQAKLAIQQVIAQGIGAVNENTLMVLSEVKETRHLTQEIKQLQSQSVDIQQKQYQETLLANLQRSEEYLKNDEQRQKEEKINNLRDLIFDLHEEHNSFEIGNLDYSNFEFALMSKHHLSFLETTDHKEFTEVSDKKFLKDTFEQVKKNYQICESKLSNQDRKDLEFLFKIDEVDEDARIKELDIKSKKIVKDIASLEKEIEKVQGYKNKKSDTSRNLKNASIVLKKIKSKNLE